MNYIFHGCFEVQTLTKLELLQQHFLKCRHNEVSRMAAFLHFCISVSSLRMTCFQWFVFAHVAAENVHVFDLCSFSALPNSSSAAKRWGIQSLVSESPQGCSSVPTVYSRLVQQLHTVMAATTSVHVYRENRSTHWSSGKQIRWKRGGTDIQMFVSLGSSHSIRRYGRPISFIIQPLIFPTACLLISFWWAIKSFHFVRVGRG